MINQSQFIEHRDYSQVSVRLHDELEAVEEKRIKAEDEANRVKDYLKEVENSRAALQTELQNLHNEVNKNIDPQTDNKANKTNVLRWATKPA